VIAAKARAKATVSISAGEVIFARAKKRFDHPGQERLAKPAKAQAGQRDPEPGCGKIGV
jgi:hypothetical protein